MRRLGISLGLAGAVFVALTGAAFAQSAKPPVSLLPPAISPDAEPDAIAPAIVPPPLAIPPVTSTAIAAPRWTAKDASALLSEINTLAQRGLVSADYDPAALALAIMSGENEALDQLATSLFVKVATDLRDGRTPVAARTQWLIKDTDAETLPIMPALQKALETSTIATVLGTFEPTHVDYVALKAALAATAPANVTRIKLIKANMDRWRWMPQSFGERYVLANVPEYVTRLAVNGKIISTHRIIVGKKDTQTPAIAAPAIGVVIHPPWYLPQSIINESVGGLIASSPGVAKARGYTWTGSGKNLAVIQSAGPNSALGYIKIDMPNSEAIFLHDTPNRNLFNTTERAYSHGCLRTEDVMTLAIILGVLQQGGTADELVTLIKAGKTVKVPFATPIPVVIGYFTLASAGDGKLLPFKDLYGRDTAIISSFDQPRGVYKAPVKAPVKPGAKPQAKVVTAKKL